MKALALAVLLSGASRVLAAPIPIADLARTEPVEFARDIQPLLKRNCLACHNTTKAKADLNLESPALMRKGGESGPAIVAGKGAESLVFTSAAHLDEDLAMPPPGNKVKAANFTPDELALLKLWIDQGAKGESLAEAKGPLPWRAAPAGGAVNAVAISPDGRLAAAARGNRVELCELASGRVLAQLGDPALGAEPLADRDAVMSVAFASDDLLATGGFRTARLWRRMPRVVRRDFGTLIEPATAMAVSPDGRWGAAGDAKGTVTMWEIGAEKFEPALLKEHTAPIIALAFSAESTALVSAAENKSVRVWDTATRAVVFKGETPSPIHALAFLEGGAELLAGCADGVARVWPWTKELPAAMPVPLREFKLQEQPLPALAVLKDHTFVWAGADGALRVASSADGKEQRKLTPEHPAARAALGRERELQVAQSLAATRKTQLGTAAEKAKKEGATARSAAETLEKTRTETRGKRDAGEAASAALRFKPDDKALQDAAKTAGDAAEKGEAALRAAKVNAELGARLAGEAAGAQASAEAASAGAEASVAEAQGALEAAKKLAAEPLAAPRQLIVVAGGAAVVLGAPDGALRHIALEDGALLEPPDRVGVAAATPAGELLAVTADKRVQLMSARRVWALERVLGNPDDPAILADRVIALAFSPDGKLLATGGGTPSRDGELKLWRTADGTLARQLAKPHADTVNALAFSPDGDFLATASSDRYARIWRVADGERIANLEGHTGHALSVAWRADGLALATGGADRSVRLWDVAARKQTKATSNFGGEITVVSYVGAGDLLLAASGDKALRLGDQPLPGAGGFPFCAASDAFGRLVVAGSHDGALRIWKAGDRTLVRTLTPTP